MSDILAVRDLSVGFNVHGSFHTAVDGVSFTIRQGATIWTAFDEQDRQQQQIGERPNSRRTDRFRR